MAARWHVPSFGYPVTRPYPYKWFPWVVLIGGILSLVLFSAINLAANGYDLNVQYTTDPNSTMSQTPWAERWPFSWFSKVDTTCQSQSLQIKSQISTDKLIFSYTVTGIWQLKNGSGGKKTTRPSLRYKNHKLENCAVNKIDLDIKSSRPGTGANLPDATAQITCFISNDYTPTWFTLSTAFDYEDTEDDIGDYEDTEDDYEDTEDDYEDTEDDYEDTEDDYEDTEDNTGNYSAGLWWWGQSLISSQASNLKFPEYSFQQPPTIENNYTASRIVRLRATFSSRDPPDRVPIWDPDFFDMSYNTTCVSNEYSRTSGEFYCDDTFPEAVITPQGFLDEAEYFAKIFYSLVLADLGNDSTENVLKNASLLQNYTHARNTSNGWFQSYNNNSLNLNSSTIYQEYLCQVPQRKPIGPLLVSIFVADLVLLQAVWKILNWITTAWTEHHQHQAKFCEGCLATMARGTYELSFTAPADVSQESSHVLSKISVTSPRGPLRDHHRSESQQSLVSSPSWSKPY
ncbi:hypothetical protein MMC07_006785 [Pseudocyphellaria aurata]|nr:hypothetical protein [Pseudocyphellaria aurata]